MALSSLEVAMQTMGSVLSDYLVDKNGVPEITKNGMNKMVKEQFPHFEKKETKSGAYSIRIPLRKTSPGVSHDNLQLTETSPGDSPLDFQQVPGEQPVGTFFQLNLFFDYLDTLEVTIIRAGQ